MWVRSVFVSVFVSGWACVGTYVGARHDEYANKSLVVRAIRFAVSSFDWENEKVRWNGWEKRKCGAETYSDLWCGGIW